MTESGGGVFAATAMSPRNAYPRPLSDTAYAEVDFETVRGTLTTYHVALIAWHKGRWHTVRVYDNAHGLHDLHRHTLSEGKQPAETFHYGTASDAFNDALEMIDVGYKEMIAGWLR